MYRLTYRITGEYEDFTTIELNETEYLAVSKFIKQLNDDSDNVQIEEIKNVQVD